MTVKVELNKTAVDILMETGIKHYGVQPYDLPKHQIRADVYEFDLEEEVFTMLETEKLPWESYSDVFIRLNRLSKGEGKALQ